MATKINRPHRSKPQPAGYIDLEISGNTRDVEERMLGLQRAFGNTLLSEDFLGRRVHGNLRERAAQRFAREGGPEVGGRWADLRPYTIEKRGGSAHPINVRTGQMKRYVLDGNADTLPTGIGASLWFPARKPSAILQRKISTAQQGKERTTGRDGSGRTVPRPVLGLDATDLTETLVSFSLYLASH